jgi:hypothetical protein
MGPDPGGGGTNMPPEAEGLFRAGVKIAGPGPGGATDGGA